MGLFHWLFGRRPPEPEPVVYETDLIGRKFQRPPTPAFLNADRSEDEEEELLALEDSGELALEDTLDLSDEEDEEPDYPPEAKEILKMAADKNAPRTVPAGHFVTIIEALIDSGNYEDEQLGAFVTATLPVVVHDGAAAREAAKPKGPHNGG